METLGFEDKTGQLKFLELKVSRPSAPSKSRKTQGKNKAKQIANMFTSLESRIVSKHKKIGKNKTKHDDASIFDDVYIDSIHDATSTKVVHSTSAVDVLMSKSVITPDFEKLHTIPPYEVSLEVARKARMKEREKTKGSKWFNLPAPEMTSDLKKELQVLQMRSVLDPKHFYKKNTMKELPKYFQVGRIVDAPADFYHSRVPKKERKKTMVEELLADAEFKKFNKKRYTEIIEERRKTNFKAHKHAKRLKNKKK